MTVENGIIWNLLMMIPILPLNVLFDLVIGPALVQKTFPIIFSYPKENFGSKWSPRFILGIPLGVLRKYVQGIVNVKFFHIQDTTHLYLMEVFCGLMDFRLFPLYTSIFNFFHIIFVVL